MQQFKLQNTEVWHWLVHETNSKKYDIDRFMKQKLENKETMIFIGSWNELQNKERGRGLAVLLVTSQ